MLCLLLFRLFDWRPEKQRGDRAKHEKTVIIKNLFEPEMFEREVHLILDYQNDLREECAKCGTVRKVVVYDVSFGFVSGRKVLLIGSRAQHRVNL